MPIVCYNRPNRSKPRVFSAKDVCRIARYAIEDGADEREIRDCICSETEQENARLKEILRLMVLAMAVVVVFGQKIRQIGFAIARAVIRLLGDLGVPGARRLEAAIRELLDELGDFNDLERLLERARELLR